MATLFAITLFVSALLLFSIQPVIGKMVLPLLGGTPAVWNTCMVFFQTILLGGYSYAFAVRRLGLRSQFLIHGLLLLLPCLTLSLLTVPLVLSQKSSTAATDMPMPGSSGPVTTLAFLETVRDQIPPSAWLGLLLFISVGLPLWVVSSTAPLLQGWFARTGHSAAPDPYFLYGASNLGSLAALWGYVVLLEPNLPLSDQCRLWTAGYIVLAILISGCAVITWRSSPPMGISPALPSTPEYPPPAPTRRQQLYWVVLAMVPSSLLLGVTTYASTDVAAIPLLWVIPLSLYLLTFVLTFARSPLVPHRVIVRAFPWALLLLALVFILGRIIPVWIALLLHLVTFFMVALVCHGELAQRRPASRHLTRFYLWLAIGGVVGGIFNTFIAPQLFTSPVEYPLVLLLSYLVIPRPLSQPQGPVINWLDLWLPLALGLLLTMALVAVASSSWPNARLAILMLQGAAVITCYFFSRRPLRFALGVGAIMLVSGIGSGVGQSRLVFEGRSFFGVLRVVDRTSEPAPVTYREFIHNTTIHGQQILDPEPSRRREPLTYYFRNGPMGQIFQTLPGPRSQSRVAVLGLGVGTLASYAEGGQEWTFYEIDPLVEHIARHSFTYLQDAEARGAAIQVDMGDGRLSLARDPGQPFDMIFVDAFSSDAVPVHLLTRQALQLYLAKLAPDGLIVFNAQNRYLDLETVMADLAADAGLVCVAREETAFDLDEKEKQQGKTPSHWVVMARKEKTLSRLAIMPHWKEVKGRVGVLVWTDDFSNLLSVLVMH